MKKHSYLTEQVVKYLNETSVLTEATNKSLPLGEISFVKKGGGYINGVKLSTSDIKSIENIFSKHFGVRLDNLEIIVDPKAIYKVLGFSAIVDDKANMNNLNKMIGGGANLKGKAFDMDFGYIDHDFWLDTTLSDDLDLKLFERVLKRKSIQIYEDIKYLVYGTSINDLIK